ncbi:glycosyltransferase family 8 protein [Pikeienuella piscinae]|uniref:Glycosyltransferase family 8 protein n=1 Tax=Pikeienuella piscinae TaxID=2748098 RepID=A0A7L5BY94_9RHOB|nr:glycosyltransferase family 8 protein [Pikeienuella piscinae]QIE55206.1 glycosyltransferase family 8 protein [Pikeienuella piscinae]
MGVIVRSPFFWATEASDRLARSEPRWGGDESCVNIVMAFDEAFAPYAAVALSTVLENYADRRPLRLFALVERALSAPHRERFAALQAIHPFELREIPVDGGAYSGLRTTPGISVATFFRLRMHLLLPEDVGRVVYLDGDIVVRRNLAELFDFDMTNAALAGVEDSISRRYVDKLGQHPDTRHINAGVMVVNLDALRNIAFEDLVADFLRAKRYVLTLGDQEVFTGILGLRTVPAPLAWNVHGAMFDPEWGAENVGVSNDMDPREYAEAVGAPAIIHYTYMRKPWLSLDHPRASDWVGAALRSPCRDLLAPGEGT